jgi:Zn-dependent membrane protease YugP
MNGKQIAERMLRENGIFDVKVVSHEGVLSDHYNPLQKTVNLSADVYNGHQYFRAAVRPMNAAMQYTCHRLQRAHDAQSAGPGGPILSHLVHGYCW